MSLRPRTLSNPTPASAICPRCHAAFTDTAAAVSAEGSERADLIESIEGYTIPHDHEAAGRWDWVVREPYRRPPGLGEGLRFRYA